jgi:hypothetical protein
MSNDKTASGHSLVSDVTPWWWSSHWGQNEIRRAVLALLATKKFAIDRIDISRDSLQVKFALGEQEDLNRTQERVNALKAALDDMVAA